MAKELPYLPSYKNVEKLLQRIAAAKQPEAFTHKFLQETIGLKSVGDRPLISLLRTLGFVDASNKPTSAYAALRNLIQAKRALATAIRKAYEPLFAADENAHKLSADALKGLVAQVAGTDAGLTTKIVGTFNSLVRLADFSEAPESEEAAVAGTPLPAAPPAAPEATGKLRTDFHYNIQIHLPANATEETYLNIFNALRKVFQ